MTKVLVIGLIGCITATGLFAEGNPPQERGQGMGMHKGKFKNMSLDEMKSRLQKKLTALEVCLSKDSKKEFRQCVKKNRPNKGKRKHMRQMRGQSQ